MTEKEKYYPLSFSSLNAFARSPLSFIQYKTAPRTVTPAMKLGTMVHRRILEPELYQKTVVVYDGRRAGNAWIEFKSDHDDRDILRRDEEHKIESIATSVRLQPQAMDLLRSCNEYERAVDWEFEGIRHRGIIDALSPFAVIDLKVTNAVDPKSMQRTVFDRRYFVQAAMYCDAVSSIGYNVDQAFIIAIESNPPYHVAVYELAPDYIERGANEWRRLLNVFQNWSGLPDHSHDPFDRQELNAPSWAKEVGDFWDDQRENKRQTI